MSKAARVYMAVVCGARTAGEVAIATGLSSHLASAHLSNLKRKGILATRPGPTGRGAGLWWEPARLWKVPGS